MTKKLLESRGVSIQKTFLTLLSLFLLTSCHGSKKSSKTELLQVQEEDIMSVEISEYYNYKFSDTSKNTNNLVLSEIISSPIKVNINNEDDDKFRSEIFHLLKKIPTSTEKPINRKEIIKFKREYLSRNSITLNIDSIFNLTPKEKLNRDFLYYKYRIVIHLDNTDSESISIYKFNDNVYVYSFCCTDNEKWIYKYTKNYVAYSTEYILDKEFQKRFVRLFNNILTKYNETNGTDYPLLDVDYEVWSGIISAP